MEHQSVLQVIASSLCTDTMSSNLSLNAHTLFSATEPSFLFQRRLHLENYLKGVFMVDVLQDSVPLLVFLGVLSTTYFDHVALRSYRNQILHLQVLEFYTRPGDLILFNGRARVSILQRSTARLLAYSAFHVRYFALRKLRTPLLSRAIVNDLLGRFTAEVEGLCYGLSIRKILRAGQVEQSRSQDSTYFCSELVAEAYQSLGIISRFSEANNFWPGSFSPGDFVDTELSRHGASLSPEIIIDCKLLEVATATKQGSSVVPLWDNGTRSTLSLDTNLKDPTFARWSKEGSLLAVGTQKGNLVLYREDRMLTVSNPQGDTIEQRELSHTPWDIKFGRKRGDSMKAAEQLIAIALSKAIILFNLQDPANPVELTFQTHYGNIIFIEWFADGMIMIAFSEGYLIVISTKIDEVGEELQSHRFFSDRIFTACYSSTLDRVALSGESGIKVVDMNTFTEVAADSIKLSDTEVQHLLYLTIFFSNMVFITGNEAHLMNFTSDGQILTVATQGGTVLNFLARMPRIHDHYGHYVAYLSSLRELSVVDTRRNETGSSSNGAIRIALSVEPSFVAIGPRHVAVGMNNRVWFYRCDGSSADALVNEQQYLGRVTSMKLNRDYAVVLCDGKASLHLIEPEAAVPAAPNHLHTAASYKANTAKLHPVLLPERLAVPRRLAYRHEDGVGIVQLAPNKTGTRIFFLDTKRRGFVLNAASRETMSVPNLPTSTSGVLWDMVDQQVFLALQPKEMGVFQLADSTIRGPEVTQLGVLEVLPDGDVLIAPQTTSVPADLEPILVSDGIVTCQHASGGGRLASLTCVTHDQLRRVPPTSTGAGEPERAAFRQNLSLLRLDEAWRLASRIDQRDYWLALAGRAMHTLDIPAARRAYRSLGDSGMVLGLDRIADIEEKNLLAGHVCMLFGDYNEARRLFLNSSDPLAALHMQRHLLQWEQALKLADSLARDLVPELSAAYATQLEFRGEFDAALRMYEHAANAIESISRDDSIKAPEPETALKLRTQSLAGVARCTFRLGDLRRGVKLVTEIGDSAVFKECAAILESMKQMAEAAALYEQGGQVEKAAQLFVQMKNLARAAPLMTRVKASKVHAQFARAKEAAGEFAAAAEAYERAGEMDNVVRLQLEHLDGAERAFEIVRETKSSEGALSAARYCAEAGRYPNAIEFLLLANKEDEAFALAQQHGEVNCFAVTLGQENMSAKRASQVAEHYEKMSPERAAEFYQAAGNYHKALRLLLAAAPQAEVLVVADRLGTLLFYVLVKKLVKRSQHGPAARMLVRVAQHLSKFPTHAANILISAVIECQRAGLRAYSYDFAATLMRTPEYADRWTRTSDARSRRSCVVPIRSSRLTPERRVRTAHTNSLKPNWTAPRARMPSHTALSRVFTWSRTTGLCAPVAPSQVNLDDEATPDAVETGASP
ncbi:WD40-repeat-containing domain [Phytophthora cactorum]|nr:WD40-repeat-containing domain [Phytophthora cactorum]